MVFLYGYVSNSSSGTSAANDTYSQSCMVKNIGGHMREPYYYGHQKTRSIGSHVCSKINYQLQRYWHLGIELDMMPKMFPLLGY